MAVGFGLGRVGIHHQVGAAGQVVDDDQFVDVQQHDVGRAFFHAVGKRLDRRAQALFDVAHGVVAEVPGQAAAKARHAGAQRHLEAGLVRLDERQRVAFVGFGDVAVLQHFGGRAAGADDGARRQADERVAAKALAAHHRLHQAAHAAALRAAVGQLEVDRQRRVEVGVGFRDQGNAVVALGGQRFEFKFSHVGSRTAFFWYGPGMQQKARSSYGFRAWRCTSQLRL
ncbi:Uncharacterised protein [Bordetella pertussis]|nr:Uncharacterised protein [Bordetella pertussis]